MLNLMAKKIDQQAVVNIIKELYLELGRVPTIMDFERVSSFYQVRKYFGGWSAALAAAGFAGNGMIDDEGNTKKRKIDQTIFQVKNIEEVLLENRTIPEPTRINAKTIATISDIHFPFENQKVIDRFIEYVGDERPDLVIINGDAWDMYSHGKFPRSHNVFTPRDEQRLSREKNEAFWQQIKKAHQKAECVQLLGNHDIRPMKRILEEYPEAEDWVKEKLKELFSYQGVKTIFDVREELIIGNIAVLHGYRTKLGDHRDYMLMNSINGHSHVGGVVFRQIKGQTLWELNSGFAGDPTAKGLTYTTQKMSNWTAGFGAVNKYGPQFISL